LVFHKYKFSHYQKEVIRLTEKILKRHSLLTAGIRVERICLGVLEEFPHLLFAAVHYFKNWGVAVTSAGIDYSKVRREDVWSKKRIINLLKRYKKKKESFRYNEFQRKHPKLFAAACYHFGSWKNALSVIGMDYSKVKKLKTWNREKIKRKINFLYRKGDALYYQGMRESGDISLISTASFCFGNWGKAVLALRASPTLK